MNFENAMDLGEALHTEDVDFHTAEAVAARYVENIYWKPRARRYRNLMLFHIMKGWMLSANPPGSQDYSYFCKNNANKYMGR